MDRGAGGLQSRGSQGVGHGRATDAHTLCQVAKAFSRAILGNHRQFKSTLRPFPNTRPYTHCLLSQSVKCPGVGLGGQGQCPLLCHGAPCQPVPTSSFTWFPVARPRHHGPDSKPECHSELCSFCWYALRGAGHTWHTLRGAGHTHPLPCHAGSLASPAIHPLLSTDP